MSAAIHPDQFDQGPEVDPEFVDIMNQPVTPQDVLAIYNGLVKRNQRSNKFSDMLRVEELTPDQVRMAFQITNEVNQMEKRMGVQIIDSIWDEQHISKPVAALYRALMLSFVLRGAVKTNQSNFWKVGCIVMSVVTVIALSALTFLH